MTSVAYIDASALVKLVVLESESVQMLRWYVEADRVVTSRVGVVETRRAAADTDTIPMAFGPCWPRSKSSSSINESRIGRRPLVRGCSVRSMRSILRPHSSLATSLEPS